MTESQPADDNKERQASLAKRLRDARINAGLKSYADASTKTGVNINTIKAYEHAKSEPSALKVARLASAYGVSCDQVLLGRGADTAEVVRGLEAMLLRTLQTIGAMSATVYVRDAFFRDDFRLLMMPGVKVLEPMHGLLLPRTAAQRVTHGSERASFGRTKDDPPMQPQALADLARENRLFGDFGVREGVVSWARLRHYSKEGELLVIVWFNFADEESHALERREPMERFLAEVVALLPSIGAFLDREGAGTGQAFLSLVNTIQDLTRRSLNLKDYFEDLLEAALRSAGIAREDGYAAVFLAKEAGSKLVREAWVGKQPTSEKIAEEFRTALGEGILSWVALKRRCLLVRDVEKSPFSRGIFRCIVAGVKSALAVPLIADTELVGVIIIESCGEPIDSRNVRWLWHAAGHAAVAYRIYEANERTERLLRIAEEATSSHESRPLDELAQLTEESLGAVGCHIWAWNPTKGEFSASGGSNYHSPDGNPPRADGWSLFVQSQKIPIWHGKLSDERAEPLYWVNKNWVDKAHVNKPLGGTPLSTRPGVNTGFSSELGLPILLGTTCLGVAWVKFAEANVPPPTKEHMERAMRVMANAGLILERWRNDDAARVQSYQAENHKSMRLAILPSQPIASFGRLTGYAMCVPHEGEIGGDYYCVQRVGDGLACVVGDAEGHGLQGALQGLPLLATAQTALRESGSNRVALARLHEISRQWCMRGTALAFQVHYASDRDKWILSAANMGHPDILIARGDRSSFHSVPTLPLARGRGLGIDDQATIAEEFVELGPDDMVIAYTDGISEARNSSGHFDRRGIIRAILDCANMQPELVAKCILEAAKNHCKPGQMDDDATIVVLRIPTD